MTTDELMAELRRVAPSVAFTVERELDEHYLWDGDGPDPAEDGCYAHNVEVRANAILGGKLFVGADYLCGSYFHLEEPTDDVHGYLPQMLEAAAIYLQDMTDRGSLLYRELHAARFLLEAEMAARYIKSGN